jgi:hypothetical protein
VAIHTPEFAFEKKIENVREQLKKYGITFPVVLDNEYGTWNAYGNNYWPRKYLIDIDGYVVYDHIGEGGYDKTEIKIQELLQEKMKREGKVVANVSSRSVVTGTPIGKVNSPETYFGSDRNEYLHNGESRKVGTQEMWPLGSLPPNRLYLIGTWNFQPEYAENKTAEAAIAYHYHASRVFFVASAQSPIRIKILRDGKPLTASIAGEDVYFERGESFVNVKEDRLYSIIRDLAGSADHLLQLIIEQPGVKAYTFTFG